MVHYAEVPQGQWATGNWAAHGAGRKCLLKESPRNTDSDSPRALQMEDLMIFSDNFIQGWYLKTLLFNDGHRDAFDYFV